MLAQIPRWWSSRHLGIPITLAPRVARATVIARVPRRTVLECRQISPARDTRHPRIPVARASRGACATVITRVSMHTVLQCCQISPARATRDFRRARFPRRSCYSDRPRPEAYCAIVSPYLVQLGIPVACASRFARAIVIARVPRRTVL